MNFASMMRKLLASLLLIAFAPLATPASAGELAWPIGCIPGIDCLGNHFRIGYPDIDGDGKAFNCGAPGYIGHTGTDVPVVSVDSRIPIMAAADGEVAWAADGASDACPDTLPDCDPKNDSIVPGPSGEELTLRINAGNFVLLRHFGPLAGYYTLYAHMRQGSVAVVKGQKVKKGEKLGEVGNSGDALVPHLHFGVMKKGKDGFLLADPWAGGCGPNKLRSMWSNDPPYRADISVSREGSGYGVVTTADGLINCGGVCSATVLPGTRLVLKAVPYRGSEFAFWSGACVGSNPECIVSVSDVVNVKATFTDGGRKSADSRGIASK